MKLHPALETEDALLAVCELTFLRRSGPGGQHRNKTETAVIVGHKPTGLRGEANERRSQAENRKLAIFRLRLILATEVREAVELAQPNSDRWQRRVHQQRLSISADHEDFPGLLAEAIDRIDPKNSKLHWRLPCCW